MTVTLAVVGAGSRGSAYAQWALEHPDQAQVVAVAEPDPVRRQRFAEAHGIAPERVYASWEELAADGQLADAVIVATLDRLHHGPVLRFVLIGYQILVEKPLAPTERECREMVKAAQDAGVLFAVGHVLRYTPYTRALKELLIDGRIGDIVSVQHLEPVGFWHQAHSFVRGNWRNSQESTSMLMAKSCHDIDWLQYIVGQPLHRVSSFGSLSHFTRANQPEGAADRCLDCGVESSCPFSAVRFYGTRLAEGDHTWPLNVVLQDFTPAALETALREGPYGRCVYACDNDAVDHQVAALEFANGVTGTFTMTAFTDMAQRKTRIFGTRGQVEGDGETLRIFDFLTGEVTEEVAGEAGGHGGGDERLMEAFVTAVETGDRSLILSGPNESLASHLAVFAAEKSRHEGSVVELAW